MARIAGVNIPTNKRVLVALTYIHGIGDTISRKILADTGVNPDMRAKDLTVSGIGDDLDKAFPFAQTERLSICLKGETADIDFVSRLLRLAFRITKTGYLRHGIGTTGQHLKIQFDGFMIGDRFRSDDAHG